MLKDVPDTRVYQEVEKSGGEESKMHSAIVFSCVNVGAGAVVSWLISHYLLPALFCVKKNHRRATKITVIYTIAALIRNVIVYGVFNA